MPIETGFPMAITIAVLLLSQTMGDAHEKSTEPSAGFAMQVEREITEKEAAGSTALSALREVNARVVTDKSGAITELMLNAVHSDEITAETVRNVRSLTSLRSVSIYVQGLPGRVVEDVASLPKLEELHLQLVALSSEDIQTLKTTPLRILEINDARIDESFGAVLGELPNLEELVFDRCTFTRGLDATFVPMPRVRSLYIDGDKGGISSQFRFLESFPHLQRLWIVRIEVDDERLARIDKLRSLEELSLQFTGVKDEGLRNLKSLTKLRRLILGNEGDFTGSGLRHLEACKVLEELSVFSTSFDDAAAGMLQRFPKLNRFVAYDTRLTDKSVESLLELTMLKLAWLSDTKISQMSITGLKQRLPKCEIK